MTNVNEKPHIDFSKASEPPRSIDLNQPDTAPVIEPDEVSKDDNLKLSGDGFDGESDRNLAGSQITKANLSAG
jgi:hypothetical protein